MRSIEVRVNNTPEVLAKLKAGIKSALEESGNLVENGAVTRCPVDTGRLRNSINHKMVGDNKVEIGSDVEYAGYVEIGTSKRRKTPYLRPALEDNESAIKSIFENNLK